MKEEVGSDNTEVPDSTFKLDNARLKLLALVECGEGLGYKLYIEQRRLLFLLWECLLTRHNEFMYGMILCCVICGLRAK